MRNRISQLVLYLGAWLCFGNGGSLLAGTITRESAGMTGNVHPEQAQDSMYVDRLVKGAAEQPSFTEESSAHLGGASLHAMSPTPSRMEFTGLHGDKGAAPPFPPQPMPDGRGSGGMGVVPNGISREPSVAMLACSCDPIQEATEVLGFQSFLADSDSSSSALFRPPRVR